MRRHRASDSLSARAILLHCSHALVVCSLAAQWAAAVASRAEHPSAAAADELVPVLSADGTSSCATPTRHESLSLSLLCAASKWRMCTGALSTRLASTLLPRLARRLSFAAADARGSSSHAFMSLHSRQSIGSMAQLATRCTLRRGGIVDVLAFTVPVDAMRSSRVPLPVPLLCCSRSQCSH